MIADRPPVDVPAVATAGIWIPDALATRVAPTLALKTVPARITPLAPVYVVLGSTGSVTVLRFNPVTCPRAFVVTESTAVNVPPDAGDADEVPSDLATSL